jgi:hypothetical protein
MPQVIVLIKLSINKLTGENPAVFWYQYYKVVKSNGFPSSKALQNES